MLKGFQDTEQQRHFAAKGDLKKFNRMVNEKNVKTYIRNIRMVYAKPSDVLSSTIHTCYIHLNPFFNAV